MMGAVVLRGTGTGARLGDRDVAGKTGTSSDWRDAWFVGYTADYTAGVWVGHDDFTSMGRTTGGTLPAQIWADTMRVAHAGRRRPPAAGHRAAGLLAAQVEMASFFDDLADAFGESDDRRPRRRRSTTIFHVELARMAEGPRSRTSRTCACRWAARRCSTASSSCCTKANAPRCRRQRRGQIHADAHAGGLDRAGRRRDRLRLRRDRRASPRRSRTSTASRRCATTRRRRRSRSPAAHAAPAHAAEAELAAFGLDPDRAPDELSGGETRRASLARAFAADAGHPAARRADQPSRHQRHRRARSSASPRFNGACLIISHDRRFLERVTTATLWLRQRRVLKLDRGLRRVRGLGRARRDRRSARTLARLETHLKAEEHWLRRGVTARRSRNEGRRRKLEAMRAERRERKALMRRAEARRCRPRRGAESAQARDRGQGASPRATATAA